MIVAIDVLPADPVLLESASTRGIQTTYRALIDTGSTRSCVSDQIVEDLGLQVIDYQVTETPLGTIDAKVYGVHLILRNASEEKRLEFMGVLGFRGPSSERYDLLLGMDVLSRGTFSLGPDTHFKLVL